MLILELLAVICRNLHILQASLFAQGKRRYDRKQSGYGGQTKPVFHKKAKTTKKVVLRLECTQCKTKAQLALKRCKHFELGYVGIEGEVDVRTMANINAVVTRRPRVLRSSSRRALRSCLSYGVRNEGRVARLVEPVREREACILHKFTTFRSTSDPLSSDLICSAPFIELCCFAPGSFTAMNGGTSHSRFHLPTSYSIYLLATIHTRLSKDTRLAGPLIVLNLRLPIPRRL